MNYNIFFKIDLKYYKKFIEIIIMSENLYIKQNVNYNEYFIHQWTYDLLKNLSKKKETNINIHIPKIISYDPRSKTLTMQKIYGDNLSNTYGEEIENVPGKFIKIIRKLLSVLSQYFIDYIDITGYNFMLDEANNLWIIDFEHANCRDTDDKINPFLLEFINGEQSWNPDFR